MNCCSVIPSQVGFQSTLLVASSCLMEDLPDGCKLWRLRLMILLITSSTAATSAGARGNDHISTTLEGPFEPVTRRFDPALRRGSDDLPMDHPGLKKKVTGMLPEQIALAVSAEPTSMWISWVTGTTSPSSSLRCLLCLLF